MAWYSGSDEAKAGIRAVRTLQALYADVFRTRPDVAKYKPQIDPIVAAADKWDAATVFFVNDDAVELGRRATDLANQIAAEYQRPPVRPDGALAKGAIESVSDAGKAAASNVGDLTTIAKYVGGGLLATVAAIVIIKTIGGRRR